MYKDIDCKHMRDNWFVGEYKDKKFSAKVFDESSKYGIEGGKISKLWIANEEGTCLADYDRGWFVEPTECVLSEYNDLVSYFEDLDVNKAISKG